VTNDDIYAAVAGLFDQTQATIQGWVNEAWRRMTADAKWIHTTISLGNTVAGQSVYNLPSGTLKVDGLKVGSSVYSRVSEGDLWDLDDSAQLNGSSVFAPSSDASGAQTVEIYPTPDTSGQPIVARGASLPADLVFGGGASPSIPADLHSGLIDGAISIGMLRQDERPDQAGVYESRFQETIVKLRARRIGLLGGATRIAVVWP
jgi:hypothetical protein